MDNPKPYRTLFHGVIIQQSDMCSGGSEQLSDIDMLPGRDGKGRFVIRGTTLAGAMLNTASKLGYKIPVQVTNDSDNNNSRPSLWKTNNSFPAQGCPQTQLRQYVKIEPETGAAEDHALFDMEVIVRGTQWHFLLEVITDAKLIKEPDEPTPEQLAMAVLSDWQQDFFFLGNRAVAGTGWCKLESLEVMRLSQSADHLWPDNRYTPQENLKRLRAAEPGIPFLSEDEQQESIRPFKNIERKMHREVITLQLKAGPNTDVKTGEVWGLDGFFIGGHGAEQPFSFYEDEYSNGGWASHFSLPEGYTLLDHQDLPDHFFVYNEKGQPFIPGSSLRGVLHHQIRRNLSNADNLEAILNNLFGTTEQSSDLYVGDAQLLEGSDWQGMVLHNHAEDEFTGGVYGSNKFVRCAIIEGTFECQIIVEHTNQATLQEHLKLLRDAIALGAQRQLPIGGKQWVDSGWIQWQELHQQGAAQ